LVAVVLMLLVVVVLVERGLRSLRGLDGGRFVG
jgi:hypothetical protein